MKNTKDIYLAYVAAIEVEEKAILEERKDFESKQKYCIDVIENNPDMFGTFYFKVLTFLNAPDLSVCRLFSAYAMTEAHTILFEYYSAYTNIKYLNSKLADTLSLKVRYEIFRDIVRGYNFELIKLVLQGEQVHMGMNFGTLYIFERKEVGDELRIDWGTSIKLRKELKKKGVPEYQKGINESGAKWMSYFEQDYTYWFGWKKPLIVSKDEAVKVTNRRIKQYHYYPASYLGRVGSLAIYTKKKPSTNEVLNTVRLGALEKMHTLLRLDPTWHLRYRREYRTLPNLK